MVYTVLLSIIMLVLIAVIVLTPQIYWYRKGVSAVPPTSFFKNLINALFKKEPVFINLQHFYNTMKRRGKEFYGYYFLTQPIFVPIDLDLIRKLLINDFEHFTDHIGYVNAENDPLSLNMFNAKGNHWRKIRSKWLPSFTSAKTKMMFDTTLKCAEGLKQLINECIDGNESIDTMDVSERFTIDVIVSYGFGIESKVLRNASSEFKRLASEVHESFRFTMATLFPVLFSLFGIRSYGEEISNFFTNLVAKTSKYRKQNGIIREDFIHHMLQAHNTARNEGETKSSDEVGLSLNEIAAQCFSFYMAGSSTSAATICFTLYELALNPDIQHKVRKEIMVVLKKHRGKITYEAIKEMEYMNNCLYESLRLYPAIPTSTRVCTKSYKIPNSDVTIDEGTYVFLPIYAVHRDPDYFPNPDKFDPNRFSEGSTKGRQHPAFIPFGDGPRKCIGYKFGFAQVAVALVVLLKHFQFFVHPDTKLPLLFKTTFTIEPLYPIKLVAEKLQE